MSAQVYGVEQIAAYGERPDSHIPTRVPTRVLMAYRFVEMCNCQMGIRGFPGIAGLEVHTAELHPAQEGVFRLALDCLGEYFGRGL